MNKMNKTKAFAAILTTLGLGTAAISAYGACTTVLAGYGCQALAHNDSGRAVACTEVGCMSTPFNCTSGALAKTHRIIAETYCDCTPASSSGGTCFDTSSNYCATKYRYKFTSCSTLCYTENLYTCGCAMVGC
jgi:hypothetical protein